MRAAAAVKTAMPLANVLPLHVRSTLREVPRGVPARSTQKSREACLLFGLRADAISDVARVVTRTRMGKGETLYRAGDRFSMLHAIRLGSFKTVVLTNDGQAQVTGYHMPGEILGSEGIGYGVQGCEAVALEDAEVWSIAFRRLEEFARFEEGVQQNLHRILAREIARERTVVMMLGTMSAEQRVARFLLDLSQRYKTLGYSSSEFVLRMTREEIGSYLGLNLETVSRLLSRLQREGVIQVQGRVVKLLDMLTLKRLVER